MRCRSPRLAVFVRATLTMAARARARRGRLNARLRHLPKIERASAKHSSRNKNAGGGRFSRRDRVRICLIGALAVCLVGCSRQSPPELALASCAGPNALACFDRWGETERSEEAAVAMDITPSVAMKPVNASSAQVHHRPHVARRMVTPA